MALTERLAYIISVDSSGAVGFDKAAVSADRLGIAQAKAQVAADKLALAQARASVVEAKAAGDADKLAAAQARAAEAAKTLATSQAEANVAAAKGGLGQAEKGLAGLTKEGSVAQSVISRLPGPLAAMGAASTGPLVAAAALAAVGKVVEDSVDKMLDLATATRSYQRVAGGSVEDASRMVVALRLMGIESDTAGRGMFKLSREVESGGAELAKYGIEVAKNKDGTTNLMGTLLNAADAYTRTNDAARRNAISFAVFGKSGQELTAILAKGRTGLGDLLSEADRHGELLHQDDIDKAIELKRAMRELGDASTGLKIALARDAAPAITDFTEKGTGVLDWLTKVDQKVRSASHWLDVHTAFHQWQRDQIAAEDAAKALSAAIDDETDRQNQLAAALEKQNAARQAELDGYSSAISAVKGYQDALATEADASAKLTDARQAGARKAQDIAAGERGVRDAVRSVGDAERALEEARAQAPRDLVKAREDEAAAIHSVADAEDDLTLAVAKYGDQSREAVDAADKLAAAKESHADASDKLNELERDAAHPRSVQDAEDRLAQAKQSQLDSQEKLNKAKAEDPAAELAKAERAAQDATDQRVIAYGHLLDEYEKVKAVLGDQVTLADLLGGKTEVIRSHLEDAEKHWRAIVDMRDLGFTDATDPHQLDPKLMAPKAPAPAPAPAAAPTTTNNYFNEWNITSTDPVGAANEVNWRIRSGGLN